MASRLESGVVYAAAAVQGIVLVTFPAASTIFTSPDEYALSSTEFFALAHRIAPEWTYRLLPFALAVVFLVIAALPAGETWAAIAAFGLAGLGCSALLPLTISFGQEELTGLAGAVAGGVIAFYQLGYGVAAFGVGPLLGAGVDLPQVYRWASVVAVVMGVLAFAIRPRKRLVGGGVPGVVTKAGASPSGG